MSVREYVDRHKKVVTVAAIALVALATLGTVVRARSNGAKYLTAAVRPLLPEQGLTATGAGQG
jgi:hypothetical protein